MAVCILVIQRPVVSLNILSNEALFIKKQVFNRHLKCGIDVEMFNLKLKLQSVQMVDRAIKIHHLAHHTCLRVYYLI
jgi:hypothetical protein